MLDFGCGPTIQGVISASKWYAEIYLSDYTQSNRKEVKKWIDRDPEAFDWGQYFERIAKFEG